RCFNSDEETMPCTVDERFIMINEQIAERIVKGIQLMYGIEFAWEVVSLDMSCLHLALRIFTAIRALAPFSTVVTQGHAVGELQFAAFPEEKDATLTASIATAL
ncbi:hypothetical protein BGZ47_009596, partial [Haplosporangium gracile]